jgi:hypothetical protein
VSDDYPSMTRAQLKALLRDRRVMGRHNRTSKSGLINHLRRADVEAVIKQAFRDTRDVARAERAGERIDPDTMGFRMKGGD